MRPVLSSAVMLILLASISGDFASPNTKARQVAGVSWGFATTGWGVVAPNTIVRRVAGASFATLGWG